jgi:hypothetical protein
MTTLSLLILLNTPPPFTTADYAPYWPIGVNETVTAWIGTDLSGYGEAGVEVDF